MSTETAARIVREHGMATRRTVAGTLQAEVQWSRRSADGTVEFSATWERVPVSSVGALRRWLGY